MEARKLYFNVQKKSAKDEFIQVETCPEISVNLWCER